MAQTDDLAPREAREAVGDMWPAMLEREYPGTIWTVDIGPDGDIADPDAAPTREEG
jgi:hypothetical protein